MRAALIVLLAATALSAQSPPSTPLDPLRFLLGTWTAKTTGAAKPEAAGEYTFHTDLNGTVIVRTTSADTCVAPQAFDCQHHDALTLYREPEDPTWRAIFFDSEGHTIHYKISFPEADSAVFLSTGPGLQFRLVYHLAQGIMTGKFQFAPSGGRAFKSYLEWSGGPPAQRDAANAPFTSSLESLRDNTRILLVFAANSADPQFTQQLAAFKGQEGAFMERGLILVPVLGHWSPQDSALYEANLPFSVEREQQYARTRFKIPASSFTVVLLGRDGGEKFRAHVPVAAKALFETVDSMPMRRLEMQGRAKEPRSR